MRAPFRHTLPALAAFVVAATFTACTPRLSPLYRDYTVPEAAAQNEEVLDKLQAAVTEAGWKIAPEEIGNLVRTEPRTLSNWGLYKVTIYLEAVPIGTDYVRFYFHPYREYVTGGRSKIPFFNSRAQAELLPELTEALEEQGLQRVGAPPVERITAAR
jgi:hypothetical protein